MGPYEEILQAILQQTLTVPWEDGLFTFVAFFSWGWAISLGVKTVNSFPSVNFVGSLLFGAMLIRYAQSYLIYHQGLSEGVWPAAWTLALVFGVACARRNASAAKGE